MQDHDEINSIKLYISHKCNDNQSFNYQSSGCEPGTSQSKSWPGTIEYGVNVYIYFRSPNWVSWNLQCEAEYNGLIIKFANPNSGPNYICINGICASGGEGAVFTIVDQLRVYASCMTGDHNRCDVEIVCR